MSNTTSSVISWPERRAEERKIYEIFVSSTFQDLQEERRSIEELIIHIGHVPVGMELFNAGHVRQWEYIKKSIDRCDYYILVVGDRYGSLAEDGKSYTQKEYEYAKAARKMIIAFVKRNDTHLNGPESDTTALNNFKQCLQQEGYVHFWQSTDDLSKKVSHIVPMWIRENPQRGWVRGSGDKQILKLQRKIDLVRSEGDVFKFLFNALKPRPPEDMVSVGAEFLRTLQVPLTEITGVAMAIETLMRKYAVPRLPKKSMRIYFAYRSHPAAGHPVNDETQYRIGISNVNNSTWRLGLLVGQNSNIHVAFTTGEPGNIQNTEFSPGPNQRLPGERSVFCVPIKYRDDSVAVLGFSSPEESGTNEVQSFGEELGIIFSSLFFAFGQHLLRTGTTSDNVVSEIRTQIASYYKHRIMPRVPPTPDPASPSTKRQA